MTQATARFYDGITPAPQAVLLSIAGPMLLLSTVDGRELVRWLLSDLRVPDQDDSIGEAMIVSRAHPAARLLVADPQTIALLLPNLPRIAPVVAPRHSNLRVWSFVAILAVAVLGGLGFAVWRGPDLLAPLVPESWERELGDVAFEQFSERFGICTAPEGRKALDRLTGSLIAAAGREEETKVVVVKDKLVNAFALPGGRIVIFDGLLQEAVAPDEVAGVFAHELGHVVHRHPLRGLMRQLGLGFVRRLLLGGYGDAADWVGGMGETMLVLRNGRDAEREADAAALKYLSTAGLRQTGLHDFFDRMRKKGDAAEVLGILSTHPGFSERMEATARPDGGKPALDYGDWQALRKICSETQKPEDRKQPKR